MLLWTSHQIDIPYMNTIALYLSASCQQLVFELTLLLACVVCTVKLPTAIIIKINGAEVFRNSNVAGCMIGAVGQNLAQNMLKHRSRNCEVMGRIWASNPEPCSIFTHTSAEVRKAIRRWSTHRSSRHRHRLHNSPPPRRLPHRLLDEIRSLIIHIIKEQPRHPPRTRLRQVRPLTTRIYPRIVREERTSIQSQIC